MRNYIYIFTFMKNTGIIALLNVKALSRVVNPPENTNILRV